MMKTRIGNIRVPFLCVVLFILVPTVYGAVFTSLGCYKDGATSEFPTSMSLSPALLSSCSAECRKTGYAFMGLRAGETCQCGEKYGASGQATSPAVACNFTCADDASKSCGGVTHNSIYYTLDTNPAVVSARVKVAKTTAATFEEARKTCIKSKGDLFSPDTTTAVSDLSSYATTQGISDAKIWIGLHKRGGFEWTDETKSVFSLANFLSFWETGDTQSDNCVALKVADNKWVTVSCAESYKYVCLNTPEAVPVKNPAPKAADKEDEAPNTMAITFYVVIPIFCVCYGGSCLVYVIAKIRRACKRKQKKKLMLSQIDQVQEFEPDNKPPQQKRAVFTVSKPTPSNRPPAYRTPHTGNSSRVVTPTTPRSARDVTPEIRQSRVDEAVQRIRDEMRRRNLLANALHEARERRKSAKGQRGENVDMVDETGKKPKKKKKDRNPDNNNGENGERKKKKKKKKNREGEQPPVENGEPKKEDMSIGEIVQMKMMTRDQQPNKPKRILMS